MSGAGPPPRLLVERTGEVLAGAVERATSWPARLRGLLGRDRLAPGAGLWIEPCSSVHTLFMRFAIDVAFLDRQGRVLRAVHRLAPFRATRVHLGARAALELEAGALERAGVREGDALRWAPAAGGGSV